jgi:hypothetical protein
MLESETPSLVGSMAGSAAGRRRRRLLRPRWGGHREERHEQDEGPHIRIMTPLQHA